MRPLIWSMIWIEATSSQMICNIRHALTTLMRPEFDPYPTFPPLFCALFRPSSQAPFLYISSGKIPVLTRKCSQACVVLRSLSGLVMSVETALESDLEPFQKLRRFELRAPVS